MKPLKIERTDERLIRISYEDMSVDIGANHHLTYPLLAKLLGESRTVQFAEMGEPAFTNSLKLIADERKRQIEQEGWTAEHDDDHEVGQLARAAACYAIGDTVYEKVPTGLVVDLWPWDKEWDKRKKHDRKRQLVIAGALIAAELDRLERLQPEPAETEIAAGQRWNHKVKTLGCQTRYRVACCGDDAWCVLVNGVVQIDPGYVTKPVLQTWLNENCTLEN